MNTTQNRGLSLATQGLHEGTHHHPMPEQQNNSNFIGNQNNDSYGQHYSKQGASLAESTLSRYNSGDNNFRNYNKNIETRLRPGTGLQHPYDSGKEFLSRFPLGFEG